MKRYLGFLLLVVCCSVQANIPAWTNGSTLDVTAQVDSKQLDEQSYTKTSSRKITEKNGFIEQSASNSSLSGENIKLNATGSVAVTGSQLQATNDLSIGEVKMVQQADGSFKAVNGEGSPNNLIVDTLELTNETWHERSVEKRGLAKTLTQVAAVAGTLMFPTLAPGLDMPAMSLGESSSQRTISTTHQGSELGAGNNMVLAAKDSVHVTSGEISAGGTAVVLSDNVTFDAAVDTHITETSHKESTIKGLGASLGKDQVTLGGMEKTKQTDTERTTTTTYQGTQINVGNLVVMADNDINFIASQVNVENDAVVQAGNQLTIEGRADSTTTETYSKTDTTTVTAGVKNAYVDTALAADALVKAGEDVKRAEKALRDAEQRVKDGTLAPSALDDYKINLAAASTGLTQATLNLAASGATAAASTGTLGFYASGKAEKTTTEQQSTTTEQQYQGSSFNVGGNASFSAGNLMNIIGSGIAVDGGLSLNAEHINISAGVEENTSHSSSQTKTAGVTASTGAGGSVGANASQSKNDAESHTLTHANSQISAGSLNSDSKSFTLAGANVEIVGDVQLNTEQLTIASVQDTHHSSSQGSSQSVGVTAGGGSINPSSAGYGQNSSSEDSQWVNNTTTFIGGGKVNINADKTTVTGGMIANATRNNDGSLTDHGNMNLVTDELIINDLQDHNRNDSKGIDLSAGLSKSGTSSVGLQKGGHNTEQTTFATLGGGTVTKKSGEQHDVTNVNRDLNNTQEITLDQQTAGLNATVTVDHRLLSEGGREQIRQDFEDSNNHFNHEILGGVVEGVKAGSVTAGVDAIGRKVDLRHGIAEIQTDPNSSAEQDINSVTANAEQKQEGIQELSNRLTDKAGVVEQNMLVYMDNTDPAGGMHHDKSNMSGVNAAVTDMTNGADIAKTTVHETTHHILNEQNNGYSQDNKEYAASKDGNYAQTLWEQQNRRNGNITGGNDSGKGMATWNANHQTNDLIQKNTDHVSAVPSSERENLPPLIPVAIAVGAMIAGDINVANAPSPDDNLDTAPQSVSLLPIDVAAEALKDATNNQYNTAIDIAAMVGNPVRLIKDGGEKLSAITGKSSKSGVDVSRGADVTTGVSNPVPDTVARVVPDNPLTRASTTLGRPGADDVFVTAADDIRGLDAKQIAERLTIPESPTGFRIIEFPAPKSGIASPVNRTDPGFIGGGRTAGEAREFVIPNGAIPVGSSTRVVP